MPDSPFNIVMLDGRDMFARRGRKKEEHGPASLLLFETGEGHSVRALDEYLVLVNFLQAAEIMRPDQTGGEIGRETTRK